MKNFGKISLMSLLALVIIITVRCSDEDPTPAVSLFNITGNVTYPDMAGASQSAAGGVVYLVKNTTTASTSYDLTSVVNAAGTYTFEGLEAGDYFMFCNFNTENENIPGGRVEGINFDSGDGILFSISDANVTQNITLVSAGQASTMAVDTREGGDWEFDFSHSNVDFEFPYDANNASYTGRFDQFSIAINFDPANLATSSIDAEIDLLSVNTSSPGGRDSFYDDAMQVWDYGCLAGTFGVDIVDDLPVETTRMATFTATGFEAYGDGYVTTGTFTFNGTSNQETLFFRFIEGFEGENRQGVQTRYSSFEGKLIFAALNDYGVESSHLLGENVTVYVSNQVTKSLE